MRKLQDRWEDCKLLNGLGKIPCFQDEKLATNAEKIVELGTLIGIELQITTFIYCCMCVHTHMDITCSLSCKFKTWHNTPSEGFPSPTRVGYFERKEPCSYQSRLSIYQPDFLHCCHKAGWIITPNSAAWINLFSFQGLARCHPNALCSVHFRAWPMFGQIPWSVTHYKQNQPHLGTSFLLGVNKKPKHLLIHPFQENPYMTFSNISNCTRYTE